MDFSGLPSSRCCGPIRKEPYDRVWRLVRWAGSGKQVLELGCSTGYVSRLLAENGCEVTGVEIDQGAAENAKRFCRDVHVSDLNALDWKHSFHGQTFDVILMGDVLEHLVDPGRLLRELRPLLRPSGCLLISLPNVVHWFTRLKILLGHFDYEEQGTLDCTHLRFFTPKTARNLIRNAGYRITDFHPAIGGRFNSKIRPAWQWLACHFPNLFAYQLLFEARI